jgi:hypothetical protein
MPRGYPKNKTSTVIDLDHPPAVDDVADDVAVATEPEVAPEAPKFAFQAQPKRKTVAIEDQKLPTLVSRVYALVSTGEKGKIDIVALHELPLLRRKIALEAPGSPMPEAMAEYPPHLDRLRALTVNDLREEHKRLGEKYLIDKPGGQNGEQVNLLTDFYGNGLRGLRDAMLRLEAGYRQIQDSLGEDEAVSDEQIEELARLADPDADLDGLGLDGSGGSAYSEFEPVRGGSNAGYVVGAAGISVSK